MQSFELEEMALFLIRDADEAEMWIDRWAISYPIVHTAEADSRQTISEWQHTIQTVFDHIVSRNIAVVAHGAGVSAFLAWLYQADIMTQKRLTNIILVSPRPERWLSPKQTARHAIGRKNRPTVGMHACFNRRIPAS